MWAEMESCVWGPCGSSGSITSKPLLILVPWNWKLALIIKAPLFTKRRAKGDPPPCFHIAAPVCPVTSVTAVGTSHMCKHMVSHFVCSRWVGRSPRAGLALSLHRFLVFGLLALFSSWGIWIAPIAVSPEEQLAIHSGKHRPEAVYLVGSGSIFPWKGFLLISSWSFPPARAYAVPVGGSL